jgi:hypothetical protein
MTLAGWIKGLHKNAGGTGGIGAYEDTVYIYNGGTSTVTRGALDSLDTVSYAPNSGAFQGFTAYVITNTLTLTSTYNPLGGNLDGVDVTLSVASGLTGVFENTPTTEETFDKNALIQTLWNRGGTGSYASKCTTSVRFD